MKTAFAVLLLAATALAACPNSCSGHGKCSETDRCICDRTDGGRLGSRAVWGGADCSMRMCPLGVGHDILTSQAQDVIGEIGLLAGQLNGRTTAANALKVFLVNGLHVPFDLNVDVEVVTYTPTSGVGPGTFRYKRDVETAWSSPVSFSTTAPLAVGSTGTAFQLQAKQNGVDKNSGVYVYFDPTGLTSNTNTIGAGDRYYFNVTFNNGANFQDTDDNTAHAVVECSGRGKCSRGSGMCECFPGYAGTACERTACPDDCSGHGVCLSLKRYAAYTAAGQGNLVHSLSSLSNDASISYANAFDATKQYTCSCDKGYRGLSCSMRECPSGADPMGGKGGANGRDCSGRGICDYSSGVCNCAHGFTGERCESRSTFV